MSDEDKELHDANINMLEKQYKWSWPRAIIGLWKGLIDKGLWVWIVFTWMSQHVLELNNGVDVLDIIVLSGWVGVTVIYLLGDNFKRGFEKLLSNSKVEASVGASINKSIKQEA